MGEALSLGGSSDQPETVSLKPRLPLSSFPGSPLVVTCTCNRFQFVLLWAAQGQDHPEGSGCPKEGQLSDRGKLQGSLGSLLRGQMFVLCLWWGFRGR